jgi:hypothetical protein
MHFESVRNENHNKLKIPTKIKKLSKMFKINKKCLKC